MIVIIVIIVVTVIIVVIVIIVIIVMIVMIAIIVITTATTAVCINVCSNLSEKEREHEKNKHGQYLIYTATVSIHYGGIGQSSCCWAPNAGIVKYFLGSPTLGKPTTNKTNKH